MLCTLGCLHNVKLKTTHVTKNGTEQQSRRVIPELEYNRAFEKNLNHDAS